MSKPKKVWAAIINLGGGLLTQKPVQFTYDKDLESWWNKKLDLDVRDLGLWESDWHYTTFASENKAEVQTFINGAKAFIRCFRHAFRVEE